MNIEHLTKSHRWNDSVAWRLTKQGIEVEAEGVRATRGEPATVRRIWDRYKMDIALTATELDVPLELIIATIATESGGKADAVREEPGYRSDEQTPHRVSAGLMQTLLSTAAWMMEDYPLAKRITREWLFFPASSITAGTRYIRHQADHQSTELDPPKVAAAYNAGGLYSNVSPDNRWKMRQYPIGTGHHLDRFVLWFNDCFRMFAIDGGPPKGVPSYYAWLNGSASPGCMTCAIVRREPGARVLHNAELGVSVCERCLKGFA